MSNCAVDRILDRPLSMIDVGARYGGGLMSRYEALSKALESSDEEALEFTFEDLDLLVGGLPPSARKFPTWWANSSKPAHQSRHWMTPGFKARPEFARETIHFTRTAPEETATRRTPKAKKKQVLKDAIGVTTRKPVELVPTGETTRSSVLFEWLTAGSVALVNGRLETPTLRGRPGVYRFTISEVSGSRQFVVGETDNLALLMNSYRHPEPAQVASVRVHELMTKTIERGGSVGAELVLAALHAGEALDFAYRPSRVLVASMVLTELHARGELVEDV
jgi:hypothetical protein